MAKPKLMSVTYTLLFDRGDNIWDNVYSLEKDLADFFAAHGLEAEVIQTIDGAPGQRMMMIKKIEEIQILDNQLKQHKGGANMQQTFTQGKAQASYKLVNKLTNSIGKGKEA